MKTHLQRGQLPTATVEQARPRTASRVKRLLIAICIAVASVNIWTGSPAAALWIGSRLQGDGPLKTSSVFAVIVVFAALSFTLVKLLAILNAAYEQATGDRGRARRHASWLRSMSEDRAVYGGERPKTTAPERIVVIAAVAGILAFEIWFFFFSGSPIDQRSGRSSSGPLSQERITAHQNAAGAVARAIDSTPASQRSSNRGDPLC